MKNVVLVIAAAGTLLAGGVAMAQPLQLAQWSLSNGPRGENDARAPDQDLAAWATGNPGNDCPLVTVREHRGSEIVVRQIHRC
jgi:hypothetical protein